MPCGTADDDGERQGLRPAARRRPVGPAPAAGPGADAAVDRDVAGFFAGEGRPDPGAGVAAAVGRRSSRRRWAIGLGVGTGLGASVAMAATVLVVVRWPDHGGAGRAGALDAALGSSLAADLVMSVATWIEYVAVLLLVGGAAFACSSADPR